MYSELDPLLPRNKTAPEITGHGFSKTSNQRYDLYDEAAQVYNSDPEEILPEDKRTVGLESEIGASPCRTFAGLFLLVVGFAAVVTLCVPGVLDKIWGPSRWSPHFDKPKIPTKILSSTPLIDGHDDLAITIRMAYRNRISSGNFTTAFENGNMISQVDLPRLKAGQVGGSFWSAYTPCLANDTNFDEDGIHARSVAMTLSQIDLLKRLTQKYSTTFASPLLNSTTALGAFKSQKLIISPISIEGLHQIGNSFSNLRLYHSLGVKSASLTHNCYNHFADPALLQDSSWKVKPALPYWGGLSPAGVTLITEMNRLGMLIDLSHTSKDTMLDVLGGNPTKYPGSKSPVIFSHSSAYALCPHPRNVPDEVLHLVAKTKSLVMVNFAPDFISCVPAESGSETSLPVTFHGNVTMHQVARHIMYIGTKIGYDHVGLGSDFDGIPAGPKGLEHVGLMPNLIAELLRMGVSNVDVGQVVGGNVLRVWGEAEQTAIDMQKSGVMPAEDEI